MAWQFNMSRKRRDAIEYRQAYKKWVCREVTDIEPKAPESLTAKEAQRIQLEIKRLYAK